MKGHDVKLRGIYVHERIYWLMF